MSAWVSEPLAGHDRAGFTCGVPGLDSYLKTIASQDVRRGAAAVYVVRAVADDVVIAYYTVSASAVERVRLPPGGKLPRYDLVPALLIGRLAVDQRHQGQGLGAWVLADALALCLRLSDLLGAALVLVRASQPEVVPFYQRFGFASFAGQPLDLFVPMATLRRLGQPPEL